MESKSAQEAFQRAVEYFGESSRTIAANTFFAIFARFLKALKVWTSYLKEGIVVSN